VNEYVTLAPRDWVPDYSITGGTMPPRCVMIPRDSWLQLGQPQTLEAWELLVAPRICTCGTCPVHPKVEK